MSRKKQTPLAGGAGEHGQAHHDHFTPPFPKGVYTLAARMLEECGVSLDDFRMTVWEEDMKDDGRYQPLVLPDPPRDRAPSFDHPLARAVRSTGVAASWNSRAPLIFTGLPVTSPSGFPTAFGGEPLDPFENDCPSSTSPRASGGKGGRGWRALGSPEDGHAASMAGPAAFHEETDPWAIPNRPIPTRCRSP